jgi:hypothetical protein
MVLTILTYRDSFIRIAVGRLQIACSIESHGLAGKEGLISTKPHPSLIDMRYVILSTPTEYESKRKDLSARISMGHLCDS